MDKIKVLVADAREIFRQGVCRILETQPNLAVICSCHSGQQTVEKARLLKPDVILLDTEIQDFGYIETVRRCHAAVPETRIIILTHSELDQDLFLAISAGASAYLSKDINVEDLIRNITRVQAGDVIISPPLASRLIEEFSLLEEKKQLTQREQPTNLSKRELEILNLVTKGVTNREIATTLFISENTVKVHMSKILEKLNVNNRQQAAILALEKGIISVNPQTDT